jgi:hypothetical protein
LYIHNHKIINMATKINNKIIDNNISDNLSIVGIVVIENGENKVIGRNHWVGQGLETIGGFLAGGASNGATSNIYIGSDTLIPTTVSMTGLIVPIGSAPGTAPNTLNVSYSTNINSIIPGIVIYNATWNAGTVSGTVGEVGLYLYGYGGLSGSTYATNPGLGARMAAADGAFTPFVINTSVALNVSWFIRFVYSSGTSVTQYITSPSLPSDPSQQPIIGITNSQSIPVPAGLQVMWQAPISSLQAYFNQYGINLNSNLSNMRIIYNGQYVPAWIESINNGIATIWMKTPVSIPANSSISLSLNAGPSFNFDGIYWGEAPQLSPTYGQYDNGAMVFNNYWNFAGTTMPSGWNTTETANLTVNNGVSFTAANTGGNNGQIVYTTPIPRPLVIEYYAYSSGTNPTTAVGYVNAYGSAFTSGYTVSFANFGNNCGSGSGETIYGWTNGSSTSLASNTNCPPSGSYNIWTLSLGPTGGTISALINYGSTPAPLTYTDSLNYNNYYIALSSWWNDKTIHIQYARVRAYPPNGVMPKVSLL